ncbi:lipoyl(octanoyl) transferase LIP2 [Sporobolomyces salmoneus]|uniref:lipoyl(octanoyl) transferase LIP2 n=1 Tax=Sporobolomyces salmoneus TaxID=183962 RepID=UPI0031825D44
MFSTLARRTSTTCNSLSAASSQAAKLSPIRWTYLPDQVPYTHGLLLQEHLVQSRLSAKASLLADPTSKDAESLERIASTDILLLLQHRPVYTAGKREKDPIQAEKERQRLGKLGADYVQTGRGGQTTYHGPGQLVGYPLIDLGASKLSTRCYVDKLETFLENLVSSFSVPIHDLPHTGVFVSPTSKIASIGVQIRRRITMHGFSINVEEQTRKWFDQIVACGLDDVTSTSVQAELTRLGKLDGREIKVEGSVQQAVELFGKQYGREMRQLEDGDEYEVTRRMIEDGMKGRLPEMKREMLGV